MKKTQKILVATRSTPEVVLDRKGVIKMSGRLIPINEYFCDPAEITSIDINLEYINSTGYKYLFYLIHKIVDVRLGNNIERFQINWYYRNEDEDMLEKGRFFSTNLNVPFNFIMIS
ncbi:MAG: DUF1987 domain-containing protein [Bacteroidales bacterium]|nr:DUF1987 domain-containing protein [Bacteroidales bacterium]